MGNRNLNKARKNKNDEFYTQLTDIEEELQHYTGHLEGKVIYMNCDDPTVSNFWRYFYDNFSTLKLKKIISTHYSDTEVVYSLAYNGTGMPTKTVLEGNGDFRSPESIEILKESDIVVSNPPFSLLRSYIAQLMEYDKDFLIIGNYNAITYKEVFPLLKDGKVWIGMNARSMTFDTPEGKKNVNACWFTSLDIEKRYKGVTLTKQYNKEDYPKYDNYDAINVDRVANIPIDYDGVMGVPITFMTKHNPEQFDILWLASGHTTTTMPESVKDRVAYNEDIKSNYNTSGYGILDGIQKYHRILIQRKEQK